ncbi:E3 ubiquitin-protein ligase XB3-like isoform X1 [Dioscorea cayenensis subsp. rotundata]|uniref:RING-type E3 ubiquitin transferase n=2 Tax=Dioscorea cayennensis subsp. rotundata TaxID=55577 RepID=A0AB40BZA8_DIOCR|nr:E3 ubiquitin-protein ligase XB3-like isoform X1 [Dioscorea cayenensis subsp. rotundata]
MGHGLSCSRNPTELEFFMAVRAGHLAKVESSLRIYPDILYQTTIYGRLSALHIAAANGRLEVLSLLLSRSVHPDLLNRHRQTPLMLAAMHGKIACVQKLLEAGANILMFDSLLGRTCLHYAAYFGHSDCLQTIISAAHYSPVAGSWGFARFVNVRDGNGMTPLHLAARQRRPNCVHILLDNGALVGAPTGGYRWAGSTPLHLAARGGCLGCVRELLTWGADRLQRDSSGRIPYVIALKCKHGECAALLNPSSAEPLVWPKPLKFISDLSPDTKVLLETALMEANLLREKKILKGTMFSLPSPPHSEVKVDDDTGSEASDTELCCICFEQACTIEVQDCGHQMCAHCTLALCCYKKPNTATLLSSAPVCPFCRSEIARLEVAKTKTAEELDKDTSSKLRRPRRSRNFCEGSSSFKCLSPPVSSFGKLIGHKPADNSDLLDKS